ncbi:hypothetical protein BV22DRAFT_353132 [Leucogyrophana mollusca]|uniref:Uncharacterized protein n=1 Tax=Leucogyrophana mollusca TaxID=85980 RepID=A0ACB8BL64_9AGAM|nr:hypothetical protein BV22DRAFT_353132 [Leucogyrophana mollusca]
MDDDDKAHHQPLLPLRMVEEKKTSRWRSISWPWQIRLWPLTLAFGQSMFLLVGWGFLAIVAHDNQIILSDGAAQAANNSPSATTLIVTLVATVMSIIMTFLFAASARYALSNRLSRPMPLVAFGSTIELSKGSFLLSARHLWWTILTLFGCVALRTLTAGWTTLLTPTLVMIEVEASGSELDLTSPPFAELLSGEIIYEPGPNSSVALIENNSFQVLDLGGVLSGNSAAGRSLGVPNSFNFNGATYNLSTGVLPSIPDYAGTTSMPSDTRLAFSGGKVPVNMSTNPQSYPQGLSRNYSMLQQGLTASVSCFQRNLTEPNPFYLYYSNTAYPVRSTQQAYENTTMFYVRHYNMSVQCSADYMYYLSYMVWADANDNIDIYGSGFIPSLVCPGTKYDGPAEGTFLIATQGWFKYGFLPATVCEVTPIITNVWVDYDGGIINATEIISNKTLGADNPDVLGFITGVVNWLGYASQGLVGNTMGDSLFSIYSTHAGFSGTTDTSKLYPLLEDYWRGVVEFTGTFLRSGYSATGSFPSNTVPANMSAPLSGTVRIATMGWIYRSPTYLLALIPITVTAFLTYAALWIGYGDQQPRDGTGFHIDPTNPSHIITAAALGGHSDLPSYTDGTGVCVRLETLSDGRQALILANASAESGDGGRLGTESADDKGLSPSPYYY